MTKTSDTPVKPRLPRGLVDRGSDDLAATHRMLETIRRTYELYGFEAVETPFFEYTDALGKFLPDQDRPNEGVFSFKDDDEQWLSLRYDLTAPLARYVAENFDRLPKPYRSYRAGYVFRNEKPGPGRFRQFMQFDADTVGSASIAADAEMCMMAADTLEALGIERGKYVIKVNNRKLLDGVMNATNLGSTDNAERRLIVLRALDKYDRFGWDGVEALLRGGRRDDSGDFTKGANLDDRQVINFVSLLSRGNAREHHRRFSINSPELTAALFLSMCKNSKETRRVIEQMYYVDGVSLVRARDKFLMPDQTKIRHEFSEGHVDFICSNEKIVDVLASDFKYNELYQEGVEELRKFAQIIKSAGYGTRRILIDTTVVRGLEYYTGPVFEAELTFEIPGDDGKPVRFGSVGGGGRFDGLVGRFRGEDVPATGFSIGVSRLYAALKAIASPIVTEAARLGPVVVLVLDKGEIARYQSMVTSLRQAGIAAELYLGASGMNAQLKYADKRGARCAIIQGSNEREHADGPQVVVRDLKLGAEVAKMTKDRADYLELRSRAQQAVPEAELVGKVREVLGQ